jgi:hypothetical protein
MASGDKGPNHSEIAEIGLREIRNAELIFPSRGSRVRSPFPAPDTISTVLSRESLVSFQQSDSLVLAFGI